MTTDVPFDALAPAPSEAPADPTTASEPKIEPKIEKSGEEAVETLLTLAEAARTVGLSERALRKHIQRGRLEGRTLVRGGRTIAAVALDALKRTYGELEMVPTGSARDGGDGSQRGTRLRSKVELEQRRRLRELQRGRRELEARLAKLKALLGMERAQKQEMQRQMRFLAESLGRSEERLEAARGETRELALEVGVARGRAEELERRLAAAEGRPPAARSAREPVRPVEDDDAPLPVPARGGVRT